MSLGRRVTRSLQVAGSRARQDAREEQRLSGNVVLGSQGVACADPGKGFSEFLLRMCCPAHPAFLPEAPRVVGSSGRPRGVPSARRESGCRGAGVPGGAATPGATAGLGAPRQPQVPEAARAPGRGGCRQEAPRGRASRAGLEAGEPGTQLRLACRGFPPARAARELLPTKSSCKGT